MDKDTRTVSFNYDQYENGESKNLIGKSKVQTNAMNKIDNHSFERECTIPTSGSSWYKSSAGSAKIISGGVDNGKCLLITGISDSSVYVRQLLTCPRQSSYRLTGFIKHPVLSSENLGKIKVGLTGTYLNSRTGTRSSITKYATLTDYI